MAVIANGITEHNPADVSGSSDNRGKVTAGAKRTFQIVVDDPANDHEGTVATALAAAGIAFEASHPRLGTAYRCKAINVTRTGPITFTATANYKTPEFDHSEPDPGSAYPWLQPAVVDYFDITTDGPVEEDVNGNAIQTANNEAFEGLTKQYSDMGIRIKKAFLGFSGAAYYTYKDAVNADEYLGFPPGVLRVVGLNAPEAHFDGITYNEVQADIACRKPYRTTVAKAWYLRVLHQGFYVRDSVTDKIDRAALNGQDVVKPVLLDGTGYQLDDGITPIWKEFEIYESVAFSGMGFF